MKLSFSVRVGLALLTALLMTLCAFAAQQAPPLLSSVPQGPPVIDVAKADGLRLDLYSASWCVPCQALKSAMRADYCGVDCTVHEDAAADVIETLKIHNYPTLILSRDGKEVARREGCPDVATLRAWIAANKDNTTAAVLNAPAGQTCDCDSNGNCVCDPQACQCAACSVKRLAVPTIQRGYTPTFGTPAFPSYGPQSYAPMPQFGGGFSFGGGGGCQT